MNADNGQEFIETSRKARLLFVGLLVVFAIVYIPLIQAFEGIRIPENASQQELDEIIQSYKKLNDMFLFVAVLQSAIFSAYFVNFSAQVVQDWEVSSTDDPSFKED